MDKKRVFRNLLRIFVSAAIILFILWKVDFKEFFFIFENINLVYILVVLVLLLIALLLSAYSVYIFLPKEFDLKKFLGYYSLSWAYGCFLPGRLGEFSIAFFLKKENIEYHKSVFYMILDKTITLIVLVLFSFFILPKLIPMKYILYLIVGVIILGLIFYFIAKIFFKRIYGYIAEARLYILENYMKIILNLILTVLKWGVTGIAFWFAFKAMGFEISLITVVLLNMAILLLSSIPITINGLGLREGIAILMYAPYGAGKELVLAVYLTLRVFYYFFATFIIFFVYILRKDVRFK
ncbi:MAG: lysylphosphatidylglycerol synthase transmembrane domain-containing protein [Candidatus Nanoarchaeia archaeon]|nr:lysylphosphatidylglycerol synthase transmembrane domain-containing protein [Candidatus Nanoarchaeia archaeon]